MTFVDNAGDLRCGSRILELSPQSPYSSRAIRGIGSEDGRGGEESEVVGKSA